MSRTWKPTTAGVINIVCGVFFLIGGITIFSAWGTPMATSFAGYAMYSMGLEGEPSSSFVTTFIVILGTAVVLLGVVSILGGIYSIKRRLWGMALAGAISTSLSLFVLGIPTIVLTAVSKREFA